MQDQTKERYGNHWYTADKLFLQGSTKEAEKIFDRLLKEIPDDLPSNVYHLAALAEECSLSPQYTEQLCLYALEKAQKAAQEKPEAYMMNGAVALLYKLYNASGKHQKAAALLEQYPQAFTDRIFQSARQAVLSGKPKLAIALFAQTANSDLVRTDLIETFVKAGMEQEILGYYSQMQKELPESYIPKVVLKKLEDTGN